MYRFTLSKKLLVISSSGLLIFNGGCTTPYKSTPPLISENKAGMLYSLPKAQVKIAAKRWQVSEEDIADVDESLEKLKVEIENFKTSLSEAKKLETNAKAAQSRATGSAKKKADENFELAQALVKGLEDMKKARETKLKEVKEHRKIVLANQGKWEETITINPLSVVADEKKRYLLDLDHNIFRNDALDISVENGLLTSSKATSDDQTKSIVLSLIQGFSAFKIPKSKEDSQKYVTRSSKKLSGSACKAYSYESVFNPTDTEETREIQQALVDNHAGVTFKIINSPGAKSSNKASEENKVNVTSNLNDTQSKLKPVDGIVYRAPLTLRIALSTVDAMVSTCGGDAIKMQESITMTVPDPNSEFILIPRAGAFTKSQFDFTFKEGSPTKYAVDRPSEMAGIASLPVDIAKALVSIPAEIIRLRVDYDSKANSAIEAKTAEYKAQLDLLKAKKELQDERKKADENP